MQVPIALTITIVRQVNLPSSSCTAYWACPPFAVLRSSAQLSNTHVSGSVSGHAVVVLLGLLLPLLLLGSLVQLVSNGLLILGVEVLVGVLHTLLVRRSLLLGLGAAVVVLVGTRPGVGEARREGRWRGAGESERTIFLTG